MLLVKTKSDTCFLKIKKKLSVNFVVMSLFCFYEKILLMKIRKGESLYNKALQLQITELSLFSHMEDKAIVCFVVAKISDRGSHV